MKTININEFQIRVLECALESYMQILEINGFGKEHNAFEDLMEIYEQLKK